MPTSLLAARPDAFNQRLSSAINVWWMETRRTLKEPRAIIEYVNEYRNFYMGRGLPVRYDPRIGQSAIGAIAAGGSKDDFAAMRAQIAELVETNKSLTTRMSNMSGEIKALRGDGKERECWNCGSKDHLGANCPEPIDEEKKKKFLDGVRASKQKNGN